jgi:aminoglycoside/choline kinase family phosphotransferase
MLMDAPPPEDVRPFVRIAHHLVQLGLSAPLVLAADAGNGFLLLEDFGDETFTRALDTGADPEALYALAVDAMAALQAHPDAASVAAPRHDATLLADEGAALYVDWFLPEATGRPTPPALRADYLARWRAALAPVLAGPRTLALRDFHVDNLMVLGSRAGVARCGLLDFQDAAIGHPAYDLVSLLEDARRDVPDPLAAAMRARHAAALPRLAGAEFDAAYAVLGAARHARVVGLWVRLDRRDGKPAYRRHLPRTRRLLARALVHPALAGVRDWFAAHGAAGEAAA